MTRCELNKLLEFLRHLKYPRPIYPDNFKSPNFELVADVLCYLAQLVDSTITIHNDIGSIDNRVKFVNNITTELFERLRLPLDGRKLYAADGFALGELIKLARYIQIALELAEEGSSKVRAINTITAVKAQSMAAEIDELSQSVQNLMKHEVDDASDRANIIQLLDDQSEMQNVEDRINQMLDEATDEVERLDKQCKMLISTNNGMEEKIRKRSIDLERTTKRLESLTFQNVRPAFMDEYEQIEEELQLEYERYIVRVRNIDYLESELRSRRAAIDSDAAERSVKRMQKRYREEELRVLEGNVASDDEAAHARSSGPSGKENSRPTENLAASSSHARARQLKDDSDAFDISMQEMARIEVSSSTSFTPRSDGLPSDPSSSSFDLTGSNMSASMSFNSDDDF